MVGDQHKSILIEARGILAGRGLRVSELLSNGVGLSPAVIAAEDANQQLWADLAGARHSAANAAQLPHEARAEGPHGEVPRHARHGNDGGALAAVAVVL